MSISTKDRVLSMTIAQLREHGLTQVTAIMLLKRLKPYPACIWQDAARQKELLNNPRFNKRKNRLEERFLYCYFEFAFLK